MQQTNHNPVKRAAAFGNGVGVFGIALLLLAVLWATNRFTQNKGQDPEEGAAEKRYALMKQVEQAQDAKLAFKELEAGKTVQVPPHVAFPAVAKAILEKQEYVIEKPEFLLPTAAPAAPAAP